MHPDLMGAPCLQTQFSQCDLTACLQYSVVGDRSFSIFKVYAPLNGRTFSSGNGGVYGSLGGREGSVTESQIGPVDLPFLHLCRQYGGTQGVFSHDQQAGGIPVQTVDAAKDKWLFVRLVIVCNGICQSVVIIVDGGMHGHISGLVNHQNILILVHDRERERYRKNVF